MPFQITLNYCEVPDYTFDVSPSVRMYSTAVHNNILLAK